MKPWPDQWNVVHGRDQALMATLRSLRAGVLEKLSGLSAHDVRRSTVSSGTNIAGLIQHGLALGIARQLSRSVRGE
jgi:hypothetical protein